MRIKKFNKFKKRKTRLSRISDGNYSWNPVSNINSPAPAINVQISPLKV